MANRPVFTVCAERPFFLERNVEFTFYSGFSDVQKERCVASLHEAFLRSRPEARPLEVSTRSEEPLGAALSAFRLNTVLASGESLPLEVVFQASKVFAEGGPYTDLLSRSPREAKRDPRLRESGPLRAFRLEGRDFPLLPRTFFYDWLYVNAVSRDPQLSTGILGYDAFTDIEFNPRRSLNTQARSAAVFVSLARADLLPEALRSPESFRALVYGRDP